jgi:V/A-type H+-transporting ATPase subunit D
MPLRLNKTALKQERDRLNMARRFLPSLDLKRQKLLTELKQAEADAAALDAEIARTERNAEGLFAVMGAADLDLDGLVRVRAVDLDTQNVVGVRLPIFRSAAFAVFPYSTLAKPFWVDRLVSEVQAMATLRLRQQVARRRVSLLAAASRRATQRYNLFDKVIIPTARRNIARIQIALADAERAAVVRSKFAKAKHGAGIEPLAPRGGEGLG